MPPLAFDHDQRFTCASCGRCCRGWDVVVTAAEADAFRQAGASRLFREHEQASEGTPADPFVALLGRPGYLRIRRRPDGACGFLSPANRCRLHEEWGAARKPLACRLFPFRVHGTEEPRAVASFSCPTIVANVGTPLEAQRRELNRLHADWTRAFPPEAERPLLLSPGRRLDRRSLETLREVLAAMLDRPGAGGRPDLRANVLRMAHTLDDLTRYRVRRLTDEAFAEYLALTGRHAAASEKPVPPRPPSFGARVRFRGLLLAVVSVALQRDAPSRGLRVGLRVRLVRALYHVHGLGPGVGPLDLRAARTARVPLEDPAVHALVHHALRSSVTGLGAGPRPLVEDLGLSVSLLSAAFVLAATSAARDGRPVASAEELKEAIVTTADVAHAEGTFATALRGFAGGLDALDLFAAG